MKFWGIILVLMTSRALSQANDSTGNNTTAQPAINSIGDACKKKIYIDTKDEDDGELIGAVRHKASDKNPRMLTFGYSHLGQGQINIIKKAEAGKVHKKKRVKNIREALNKGKSKEFIEKARHIIERLDYLINEAKYNKIALEHSGLGYSSLTKEIRSTLTRTANYQKSGLTKEESENYVLMRYGIAGYLEYKRQLGDPRIELFGANSLVQRMVHPNHFNKLIGFGNKVVTIKRSPETQSQISDPDYKKFIDLFSVRDGAAPLTADEKKLFNEGFKNTSPEIQAEAQKTLKVLNEIRERTREQNKHISSEMNKNVKKQKDKIIFIGGSSHALGILKDLENHCSKN